MIPQPYISGVPVATLAPVSDLVIAHEFPAPGLGGPRSATFGLLLAPSNRPGWITKGATADIRFGAGLPILAGTLGEPDWVDGTILINAAATEGDTTACLNTDQATTSSTPDTVIDAARARGALTWSRPASISATALASGDTTANLNSVINMVAAYCDANTATRLIVDPWRQILATSDPTAPDLFILPGSGELAWSTDQQATRVFGRWADATGKLYTTSAGSGAVERLVDLTKKGPLTLAQAQTLVNSILARCTSGGWTNGLTVTSAQIVGNPHLASVAARVGRGLMVRILGQRDPRPDRMPVPFLDVIIERSEWHVADQQIILTPRGMVARDFTAILAEFDVQEAA